MTSEELIKSIENSSEDLKNFYPHRMETYQDLIGSGIKVTKKEWEEVLEKESKKFQDDLHMELKKALNKELVNENYEFLYSTDDLVSNNITWNDTRVKVKFFDLTDIKIPWWKFWISKMDIANKKNVELWHEACAVAKAKKLQPVGPPCKYGY